MRLITYNKNSLINNMNIFDIELCDLELDNNDKTNSSNGFCINENRSNNNITSKNHTSILGNNMDCEVDLSSDNNENLNSTSRIVVNVGGKKMDVKKSLLDKLNVNNDFLTIQDKVNDIYFLDRDPLYFQEIAQMIKSPNNKITVNNLSNQIVGELCNYNILQSSERPLSKIKLVNTVTFKNIHTNYVKILVEDQIFETYRNTLLRSEYLKNVEDKCTITNIDPKIFRYVLNILRNGELYIYNSEITEALDRFGIEFTCSDQTYNSNFISCYQHVSSFLTMNMIPTKSLLKFDSTLHFVIPKIKNATQITSLAVYFDLPKLDRLKGHKWCSNVGYNLVDSVNIEQNNIVMYKATGKQLYLEQQIFSDNSDSYRNLVNSTENRQLLFRDNKINVTRLVIPLFLNKNYIAFIKNKIIPIQVFIKIPKLSLLIDTTDIKLLNAGLICNYTSEIINSDIRYFITCSTHKIELKDTIRIKIDQYSSIKNFFFTFAPVDSNTNVDNILSDNFIELRIYKTVNNKEELMIVLDSIMLNMYIPLNILGKVLPSGIYYFNFADNFDSRFNGQNHFLEFSVKKQSVLNLHINNYNICTI